MSGQPVPDRADHHHGHLRLQGARGGGAQGGNIPQHGDVRQGDWEQHGRGLPTVQGQNTDL